MVYKRAYRITHSPIDDLFPGLSVLRYPHEHDFELAVYKNAAGPAAPTLINRTKAIM